MRTYLTTIVTLFVFYQEHRFESVVGTLGTRLDKLERTQDDMRLEQTRRLAFVQRIPTLESSTITNLTDISRNTAALKTLEDKVTTNAMLIGDLRKELEVLRGRMNDLLYVKRIHPPMKKERPRNEP